MECYDTHFCGWRVIIFFFNFVGPAFAGWTLLARLRSRGTRDAIRAWFGQSAKAGAIKIKKKNYDPTLSKKMHVVL